MFAALWSQQVPRALVTLGGAQTTSLIMLHEDARRQQTQAIHGITVLLCGTVSHNNRHHSWNSAGLWTRISTNSFVLLNFALHEPMKTFCMYMPDLKIACLDIIHLPVPNPRNQLPLRTCEKHDPTTNASPSAYNTLPRSNGCTVVDLTAPASQAPRAVFPTTSLAGHCSVGRQQKKDTEREPEGLPQKNKFKFHRNHVCSVA